MGAGSHSKYGVHTCRAVRTPNPNSTGPMPHAPRPHDRATRARTLTCLRCGGTGSGWCGSQTTTRHSRHRSGRRSSSCTRPHATSSARRRRLRWRRCCRRQALPLPGRDRRRQCHRQRQRQRQRRARVWGRRPWMWTRHRGPLGGRRQLRHCSHLPWSMMWTLPHPQHRQASRCVRALPVPGRAVPSAKARASEQGTLPCAKGKGVMPKAGVGFAARPGGVVQVF